MLYYNSMPTTFTHEDTIVTAVSNCSMTTKEYYYKRGGAPNLPIALKCLNFYAIVEDILIHLPRTDSIKRSTDVPYYLRIIADQMRPYSDNNRYAKPFGIEKSIHDLLNPKDIFSIRIIPVVGQIQDTFERYIPEWATANEAIEVLGVSLALKLSPKHRIRVYKKGDHIIVFTTKGVDFDDSVNFVRKLWACIPLLRDWTTPDKETEYAELTDLFKTLGEDDAAAFWLKLEAAYNNSTKVKELKYSGIIQTFNSIKTARINAFNNILIDERNNAARILQQYTDSLSRQRDAARHIMEIEHTDNGVDTDTIKRLVDKKICYNLTINNGNGTKLSYRCAAPLLSYDKEVALVYYNKRIKGVYNETFSNIFKLLFVDEKVVLVFDEGIDISLSHGNIQAKGGYTTIATNFNTHFPNPHHYYYNCFGSYATTITKLIHEYKLEELFYQVKAAIGSLNFTDFPVMSRFVELLADIVDGSYTPACFYWRDENCTTLHTFEETIKHFAEEATE